MKPTQSEIRKAFATLSQGRFNEACRLARALKDKYPDSRTAEWLDVVMIADRAEYTLTGQRRHLALRPCIRRLVSLSRRLRGAEPKFRSRVLNELYYFTRNFKKQIQLGKNDVKRGDSGGHYSIGVGATWHALSLAEVGNQRGAMRYAKAARSALEWFIAYDPNYSNTYLQLSIALGILGYARESTRAFNDGKSRLSGDKTKISRFFGRHRVTGPENITK